MNDLDYTGYGPTSAGRAPSAAELRRAAYNRQHTSRAIQAMQYIDPVAIAASERMVRLGMGEDKSPQAVRRALHSTAAGQATLDAAFAARSAGLLGYGDPRQYSANITQMLSGGFTQDVSGGALDTQAYRTQGFGQRVTGNGVIAERAAIVMQKQMLDDLYGEDGLADPSRLNGYDMTEASQVAARVVGRRGMGKMMHLQKNADIGTRIGAALQAEVDPNVRAGLESLTDEQKDKLANAERSGDSGKFDKAVAEISASLDDPKAREAFQNIAKSKDAMVFNEKNAKKLHDTVREVTKGMAALNDIYGDLSSDDAHAMLEQIHGGRITNKQQARAAARTVDNMRNAAEYAGMDPKQLMGLFAGIQQTLSQQLGKQLNLDERDEGAREETAAKLAAKFAPEAAVASKNIAEARAALGLPGEGRSPQELAADNARMQMEANEKYGGYIYSQGDMSGLNDDQKAKMLEQAKVFKQAAAEGDTQKMYVVSKQMEKIVSKDFAKEIKQGAAKADMLSGQAAAADEIRDMTRMPIAKDFALTNRLGELTINTESAEAVRKVGGVKTLKKLADIEKIKPTEERIKEVGIDKAEEEAKVERDKQRDKILTESGASEQERAKAMRTIFDKDGKMKEHFSVAAEVAKRNPMEEAIVKKVGGAKTLSRLAKLEDIQPTEERIKEVGLEKAEEEAKVERDKQREKILAEGGISSTRSQLSKLENIKPTEARIKEVGLEQAEQEAKVERDKQREKILTESGVSKSDRAKLANIEKIKPTEERIKEVGLEKAEQEAKVERDKQREKILTESGVSDRDLTKAVDTFYNKDGSMKDEFKNYKEATVFDKDKTRKFNEFVLNKMGGVVGLGKLAQAAEVKPLDEERVKLVGREQAEKEAKEERDRAVNREFDLAEATDEERALAKEILLNRDGSFKDEARKYGDVLEKADYSGGQNSIRDKNERAEIRLKNLEKNDKRQRMTDKDNKISIRGVAQSMLRGEVQNPLTDADTAGAALDALQSSGVPLMVQEEEEYLKEDGTVGTRKVDRNLAEKYVSGIKLNNLDDEALTKIDKVAGKEVNLVDRVNKKLGTKMTREEFIKKSKTDKKLQDAAFTELAEAGDELGFSAGGARDNISVVSDDVGRLGGKFTDRFNKLKTLESVSGFVGDEEMSKLTNDVLQGRDPNLGDMIEADEYDANNFFDPFHDKVKTKDGKGYAAKLENSGRFQAIADIANKGDKKQTADVAAMLGDKGIAAFEQQIKAMESALASGDIDPVNGKMVDDKGVERELNEKTINEMKAALAELRQTADESGENGAQKIGVMTVTKLEVTGGFYNKKE